MERRPNVIVFLLMLVTAGFRSAEADVVAMHDGRWFQGTVVNDDEKTLKIDAMVAGIRVTLTLQKNQIRHIENKSVPDGFYDPKPVVSARDSDPTSFDPDDTLYLEVPIIGEFDKQIVADGVRRSLAYASRYNIKHIVFEVDSVGGNIDVASELQHLLKRYNKKLTFHAIIRQCLGEALVVPNWCDTIHISSGARVGGGGLFTYERLSNVEGLLVSDVAYHASQVAQEHGRPGLLIRAMIDPAETLAAWQNDDGQIRFGKYLPDSVLDERVIFVDDSETVLTLTTDDVVRLGLSKPFDGSVDGLGAELGYASWKPESDYGRKAMRQAAERHRKQRAEHAARVERQIKESVNRRAILKRYVERHLKRAHEWEPRLGTYSTYQSTRHVWDGWGGSKDTHRLTRESRKVWRNRTDVTLSALRHARKGAVELKRLDQQAVELGLEPSYVPGELDSIREDTEIKIRLLVDHRNRKNH